MGVYRFGVLQVFLFGLILSTRIVTSMIIVDMYAPFYLPFSSTVLRMSRPLQHWRRLFQHLFLGTLYDM